jgi:hypothetical protein
LCRRRPATIAIAASIWMSKKNTKSLGAYFPSSDALQLNRAAHEITSKANSILLEKK